jgi:GR25 family glycosyltransferase involved in LPS biosynthesis
VIFFENLPIYYINLDKRVDRRLYFNNQVEELNLKNVFRIKAVDGNSMQEQFNGMSNVETACSVSHLLALKEFLESDFEFAIICEDDVDLLNSKKINFNFYDIFKDSEDKPVCLQTSISLRKEDTMPFKIVDRSYWYFCTASYIVNKKYAQILVDSYFINNKINFDNFQNISVIDPRGGFMDIKPVADQLVYSLFGAKSVSLFTIVESVPDIGITNENQEQVTKCIKDFYNYWSNFQTISIEDII